MSRFHDCLKIFTTVLKSGTFSPAGETGDERKRRVCRMGAGVEQTFGVGNTPGFKLRDEAKIVQDLRGFKRIELPRNDNRVVQSSLWLAQGWRANCDIQILLYDSDPEFLDDADIAKVTDYIVAYACKGVESLWQERAQMNSLALAAQETVGGISDVRRLARKILNMSVGQKLYSKQEAMVHAAGLHLYRCSESFERVSLSGLKRIGSDSKTFLSTYAKRKDDPDNLSLHDYYKKKHPNKIAVYTGASCHPVHPPTQAYARSMIMIHKPWIGDFKMDNRNFISEFENFLADDTCPKALKIPYERVKARVLAGKEKNEPTSRMEEVNYDTFTTEVDESLQEMVELSGTIAQNVSSEEFEDEFPLDFGLNFDWCQPCVKVGIIFDSRDFMTVVKSSVANI